MITTIMPFKTMTYSHGARRGTLGRVATERRAAIGAARTRRTTMRRHTTHVMWGGRGRAVRCTYTGIVLGATPRQTNPRVTDRVTLHLVDCHFGRMAMDELHEAAALAGGDLDVGDLAKALEEGAKLVLGDVARQTADEDSRVVGISELIHGLHGVERCALIVVGGGAAPHRTAGSRMTGNGRHHLVGGARAAVATVLMGAVAS